MSLIGHLIKEVNMQKLSQLIKDHDLPLGTTEQGRMYALKTLHPADPVAECTGVPTGEAQPVVVHNYQMSSTIAPPGVDETKGTWDATFVFLPHPVVFGYCTKSYSDGTSASTTYFINSQLLGNDAEVNYNVLIKRLTDCGEEIRLAYWGVTGDYDAPALSNQGTLVAAQYPLKPRVVSLAHFPFPVMGGASTSRDPRAPPDYPRDQEKPTVKGVVYATKPLSQQPGCRPEVRYEPDKPLAAREPSVAPRPSPPGLQARPVLFANVASALVHAYIDDSKAYDTIMNMPNAMLGLTKDGFYMPGQVDASSREFKSMVDRVLIMGVADSIDAFGMRGEDNPAAELVTSTPSPPFGCHGPDPSAMGQWMLPQMQTTVGQVSVRNMSVHAAWSIVFRYGFELKVGPGSSISMFQKMPPTRDEVALAAVLEMQRRFKHAFPAEFNHVGKVLKYLGGFAQTVAPLLPWPAAKMIGGFVGSGISRLGTMISSRYDNPSTRDTPPAASVDDVRKALAVRDARLQVNAEAKEKKKKKKGRKSRAAPALDVSGIPPSMLSAEARRRIAGKKRS